MLIVLSVSILPLFSFIVIGYVLQLYLLYSLLLLSKQGFAIQLTQSRELSELRKSTKFHLYNQNRRRKTRINQEPDPTILQLQYYLEVIPTLISDITDQESSIIMKRDNTRSLLPKPVNHVAFTKENPSYIGPGNLKN